MTGRTLVLGSGIVGRAAAWDLQRRGYAVIVADADEAAANRLGIELDVPSLRVDATDESAVAAALADVDAVISAVPFAFGVTLAEAAIRSGTHYFDFGGNPTIVKEQLQLHDLAQAADVAVVPDCGLAPGLANVMAAGLMAAEADGDPIEDVQIRVGVLPQHPQGTLQYQLAFYAGGLINEYAEPCEVITEGGAATVEPLTRFEEFEWQGLGTLEAFATAGGTSTMCQEYAGRLRTLEYKTIRFPGHGRIFAAMREIGLFDTTVRPLAGAEIAPRQLLINLLNENLPRGGPDQTLVSVVVRSRSTTKEQRVDDVADASFSSLARTTAFPTTALCDLILRRLVKFSGVAAMHAVAPAALLRNELTQVGITIADQ